MYASISAGSVITAPTLASSNPENITFCKKNFGFEINKGLGLVDFYMRPHFNAPKHVYSSRKVLEKIAKEIPQTIYGIDDQMAIKVVDGKVEVIGEGDYLVFNK